MFFIVTKHIRIFVSILSISLIVSGCYTYKGVSRMDVGHTYKIKTTDKKTHKFLLLETVDDKKAVPVPQKDGSTAIVPLQDIDQIKQKQFSTPLTVLTVAGAVLVGLSILLAANRSNTPTAYYSR